MVEVALIVSIVSVSFSVYFGLRNNKRADNKELTSEIAERVTWNTKIEYKIDSINTSVTEINNKITAIVDKVDGLTERMVKVESSCKSAHKRIDAIEGKDTRGGNDDDY